MKSDVDRKYHRGFLVKPSGVFCGKIRTYANEEILFRSKNGRRHWSRVENYYEDFYNALNSYLETFSKEEGLPDDDQIHIALN